MTVTDVSSQEAISSFITAPLRAQYPVHAVDRSGRLRSVLSQLSFDTDYVDPKGVVANLIEKLRWSHRFGSDLGFFCSYKPEKIPYRVISLIGGSGQGKTRCLMEVGFRHCIQGDECLALYITYGYDWASWPLETSSPQTVDWADLACRVAFAFYRQVLLPVGKSSVEWQHFPTLFPTTVWDLSNVMDTPFVATWAPTRRF